MRHEKNIGKPESLPTYFNENPLGLRTRPIQHGLDGHGPPDGVYLPQHGQGRSGIRKAFILRPSEVVVLLVQQNQLIQQNQLGISFARPRPDAKAFLFLIQLTGDRPRVIGVQSGAGRRSQSRR